MSEKAVHIALYPSDWLAGTRGLTPAETGVYITLVCMMYERQSPLPFDHARLARMCNCPAGTFKKILAVLIDERKLIETPDGLWQRRVDREIAAAKEAIGEASERAKRAADARWSKSKGQSGECENAKVKRQSDEQQSDDHRPKKSNENSEGNMQEQCPSNANQNQNQNIGGGGGSACAHEPEIRERVLAAMGVSPDGVIGPSKFIGGAGDVSELRRWLDLPNLNPDLICAEIARISAGKRDGPPKSFTYFTEPLRRLSGQLSAPALKPIEGTRHDPQSARTDHRAAARSDATARQIAFAARAVRTPSDDCF
ncbi:YdaU family protein [Paracoccus homiensis]|uniref:Uncharacterized conserved protein YdaU, DUF1376 family n=1 Tax=Paracoccus homiensis TaxID=364199 RepID=A0A1I0GWF3_9RHOB|nr:DUF1376 domain-containing protein [Paracoccus homiensis]SET75557.1 Uncharacterized conserved protein YdaU, DUF1376 family [Paracoccus homiensis]